MAEHTHTDTSADLIINRMSRSTYEDLLSNDLIYSNQLYLIDDPNFDVFNKRIVNLNPPEDGTDAVNLEYLEDEYLKKAQVTDYVDKSRIYSLNLTEQWPNGQTYICGDKKVYVKDTTRWEIAVISGSASASDITVVHNSSMGWQFKIGSTTFGQNMTDYPDTLHDSTTYSGETLEVSATSWHYQDTLAVSSVTDAISAAVKLIGDDYLDSSDKEDILNQCLEPDEVTLYKGPGDKDITLSVGSHGTVRTHTVSLSDFYLKNETSGASELSDGFQEVKDSISCKVWFKEGDNSGFNDLSVIQVTNYEYEHKVINEECVSNAIYIIEDAYHDAFNKVISNLVMTDDQTISEAATQHYVDNYVDNKVASYKNLSAYVETEVEAEDEEGVKYTFTILTKGMN